MSVSTSFVGGVTSVVSPVVTQYSPDAYMNVDAQVSNNVAITGIVNTFSTTLSLAQSTSLLNAFDVSGFFVDCRLTEKDPNVTRLNVSMHPDTALDASGVISHVVENSVDSSGDVMDKWLAVKLRDAFVTVFANLLNPAGSNDSDASAAIIPSSTGPDGLLYTDGSANAYASDMQAQQAATLPGTSAGAAALGSTVSVTTSTKINGFSVDVFTDPSAAATNLWIAHNAAGNLKQLFLQIPRATWMNYMDADASGEYEVLDTDALPMKGGDKITFVFDVDVNAAGDNRGDYVPGADGVYDAYHLNGVSGELDLANSSLEANYPGIASSVGNSKFQLKLDNKRVAFEITLGGTAAAAFTVGAAADGANPAEALRASDLARAGGANPGAGTGAAN
jgi:hypothetical protein